MWEVYDSQQERKRGVCEIFEIEMKWSCVRNESYRRVDMHTSNNKCPKTLAYYATPQMRVLVTKPHNKTPYELLLGRTPSIGLMRPFGCLVTILNTLDPLGMFDGKANEGFLVRYSVSSIAFRVFNSRTRIVQETLHINFLENQPNIAGNGPTWLFDINTLTQSMNYQPVVARNQPNSSVGVQGNFNAGKVMKEAEFAQQYVLLPLWSTDSKDPQNIDVDAAFTDKENESEVHVSPSSSDKPKKHDEKDKREAKGKITAVGPNSTNNTNSFCAAGVSNTAVSPNFDIGGSSSSVDPSQYPDDLNMPALEGIIHSDDEEDVGAKADFSNLETRFKDPDHPDKVYKVVKALYGLHQAFRAWYETLANYLLENGFQRGKIDQTLFIKKQKGDILLVQVYMDDIFFVSTNKELCKAFEKLMKDKFQMSLIGELTFFIGLQVKQKDNGIFIRQDKYVAKILRKFGLTEGKSASTPIDTKKPLLKDPDDEDTVVATSSTKAKYVAAQFWTSVLIKSNDVVRLQALIDRKKVIINEDTIRQALRLDDADGVDCLPNEEIFVELSRMGYEKPMNLVLPWIQLSSALLYLENSIFPNIFDTMAVEDAVEDEDDDNEVSAEPTPPLPIPIILPPSPTQEHIPSPPQAHIGQPTSSMPQQPSQTADISMNLLNT
nr:putative ribonuclease H-like domain-containing protein [Tanacetum cinerariifolium]